MSSVICNFGGFFHRFGWFGLKPEPPCNLALSYAGLAMCILRYVFKIYYIFFSIPNIQCESLMAIPNISVQNKTADFPSFSTFIYMFIKSNVQTESDRQTESHGILDGDDDDDPLLQPVLCQLFSINTY